MYVYTLNNCQSTINKTCAYVDILEFEGYAACLNLRPGGEGKGEGRLDICSLTLCKELLFDVFYNFFIC